MRFSCEYQVRRGKEPGLILTPHRYKNGQYLASETKFGKHFWLPDIEDVVEHIHKGYSIRMSCPDSKYHRAPSLIRARFINVKENPFARKGRPDLF